MRERVAILEHELNDAENETSMLRSEMHEVEKRAMRETHEAHKTLDARIDKEVIPAIQEVQRRGSVKVTISLIALLVSLAANIIALYRYFVILKL